MKLDAGAILRDLQHKPELDAGFLPAVLWNRSFHRLAESADGRPLGIALQRLDGTTFIHQTRVLSPTDENQVLNVRFLERLVKFLLWQKGGCRIFLSDRDLARALGEIYNTRGARGFDHDFIGNKIFGLPLEVSFRSELPKANETASPLGRNLDGYRIGFDLGGSDRKCAAVVDGEVIFSEEIKWNPYFEKDPEYHVEGINDSIRRAAEKMPRVDAIGGSAAGVYVNNEVRAGSLFRGLSDADFTRRIKRVFFDLKKRWGDVPFEVANDGEVAALAGSMELGDNAVLGISMGTSLAAGYVTPDGTITPWLNELAFAPVDYRPDAPADEWSGDFGCGAQYFSQQAIGRLAPIAGIELSGRPLPEQLVEIQNLMQKGDERAAAIFRTIGVYLGYTVAHLADFYDFRHLLIMGRVTSGIGGEIIIEKATRVIKDVFSPLSGIKLCTPNEKMKRHGQAIAAASLPGRGRKEPSFRLP